MASEDRPAMPWYVKDWLASEDRHGMTYEERGVYRDLIDQSWLDHGLPSDRNTLMRMLGLAGRKFALIWGTIGKHFEERDGRLYNAKQERVRAEMDAYREERRQAGSRGGKSRAARLANAKQTGSKASSKTVANGVAKPYPSSSSSSSEEQIPAATVRGYDRSHANHIQGFCAFKCLSDTKINEFAKDMPRGWDDPENYTRVLTWAEGVRDGWGDKPKRETKWFEFWEARWRERMGGTREPSKTDLTRAAFAEAAERRQA
jgi:uncharacterized protein YdaU (DUF1376 family)